MSSTGRRAVVVAVNVGMPREVQWRGQTIRTAIWKSPVSGRVRVGKAGFSGDGQADLVGHGGEHRAVMVYQLDSYRYWAEKLRRADFVHGQFGENLTVEGLADAEVCIGDRFRIGSAVFEVTQPRVTCFKVGIRLDNPQMAALLVAQRRPGFYFRVIEEGDVAAGDAIEKVAAGAQGLSVAAVDGLLYSSSHPVEGLERAVRMPALSTGWRRSLQALLDAARRQRYQRWPCPCAEPATCMAGISQVADRRGTIRKPGSPLLHTRRGGRIELACGAAGSTSDCTCASG